MSKRGKLDVKGLSRRQIYGLVVLLVLPDVSLFQLMWVAGSLPLVCLVCGGLLVLQFITYFQVRSDKRRAQSKEWRVPESRLHSLELLGGWPASFVAQRRYRHKISKSSYQFIFWLIVLLYQVLAVDYLLGGPLSEYIVRALP